MYTLHILDRDGTVADRDSNKLYPDVAAWLSKPGSVNIALCSNQGGVACKLTDWGKDKDYYPTQEQAEENVHGIAEAMRSYGAEVREYVAFAYQNKAGVWLPTPPNGADDPRWRWDWRKPLTGMAFQAMQDFGICDPARVLVVGDRSEDELLAEAIGSHFQWHDYFFERGTEWITLKEAHKLTGKSLSTLNRWVETGKLRHQINLAAPNRQRGRTLVSQNEIIDKASVIII